MRYLIVGSGGLLGSAVTRVLTESGRPPSFATGVPWHNPESAVTSLVAQGRKFLDGAEEPWSIIWCAGAAITQSESQEFDSELLIVTEALAGLDSAVVANEHRGALVVLSSAGGIYGGSFDPPFSEDSTASPLGEYGAHKLRCEAVVAQTGRRWGVPAGSARLSNVFGPGQDVRKAQGLISRLCISALQHEPFTVYVPLDTTRDYIYVDDAARKIVRFAERVHPSGPETFHIKIVASGVGRSVASVIGEFRSLPSLRPLVVQRSSELTALQARDLRVFSNYWREIDAEVQTPMAVGIAATAADLARRIAHRTATRPPGDSIDYAGDRRHS